jgi:phage baseplate assembly protein W
MERDYLGRGVAHPARIDTYGRQALIADVELVKQSIQRILSTPVGSDFMNRAFGSEVRQVEFEPNDTVSQALLEYFIGDAIDKWEKRVRYVDTEFETVGVDQLNARVLFQLLGRNEVDSYVYPFYRENRF